jgi:hypothetical protein
MGKAMAKKNEVAEAQRAKEEKEERAKEEDEERKRKAAEAANQRTQPLSTATKPAVIKLTDNPKTLGHFKGDYDKLRASYDVEVKTLTPEQKKLLAPEMARQEARFENITQQRLLQAEIASAQGPDQKNLLQAQADELLAINLRMDEIYNRAFAAAGARGGGPVEYSLGDQKQLRDLQTKQHAIINPSQIKAVRDAALTDTTTPAAWTAPTQQDQEEANSKLATPPTKLTIEGLQKISDCPAGIQLGAETHQGTVVSCASKEAAETFAKKFRANVSVEPDKQNNGRFIFIISHKTAKAIAEHQKDTPWISMDERDKGAANGATAKSQSPQATPGVPQPSPNAIVANAESKKQKPGQLTSDHVKTLSVEVKGVQDDQNGTQWVYFATKDLAGAFAKKVFGEKPPGAKEADYTEQPGTKMFAIALDSQTAKAIMEHATNLGAEERATDVLTNAKVNALTKKKAAAKTSEELQTKGNEHKAAEEALAAAKLADKTAKAAATKEGALDAEVEAAATAKTVLNEAQTKVAETKQALAAAEKGNAEAQAESEAATESATKLQADLLAAAEKTADAKATGFIPVDKRKEMAASKVEIDNQVDLAKGIVNSLTDSDSKAPVAAGAGSVVEAQEGQSLTNLRKAVSALTQAEQLQKTATIRNKSNQTAVDNARLEVKQAMDAYTNPPTHKLSEGAKSSAQSSLADLKEKRNTAYSERNAAQTPKAIELAQHKLNKAEQAFAVATQATEKGFATPAEALKLEQQALDAAIAKTAEAQSALVALKPKAAEVALVGAEAAAVAEAPDLASKAGSLAVVPPAPAQVDQSKLIADFIAAERALFAEPKAPAAEGDINLPLNVPTDKETARNSARAALAEVISGDEDTDAKITALQTAIATEMTAQDHVKKAQAAVQKNVGATKPSIAPVSSSPASSQGPSNAAVDSVSPAKERAALDDPLKLTEVENAVQMGRKAEIDRTKADGKTEDQQRLNNVQTEIKKINPELAKTFSQKDLEIYTKIIAKKDEIKTAQAEEAKALETLAPIAEKIEKLDTNRSAAKDLIDKAKELGEAQKKEVKASKNLTKLQQGKPLLSSDAGYAKDLAEANAAREAALAALATKEEAFEASKVLYTQAATAANKPPEANSINSTKLKETEKTLSSLVKQLDNQLKAEQAKLKTSLVGPDNAADTLSKASSSVEKKMGELAKLQEKLARVSQEKASGHEKTAQKLEQGGVFTKGIKDLEAKAQKQGAEIKKQTATQDSIRVLGGKTESLGKKIDTLTQEKEATTAALNAKKTDLSEANAAKEAQSKIAGEMGAGHSATKTSLEAAKTSRLTQKEAIKAIAGASSEKMKETISAFARTMRAGFETKVKSVQAPSYLSPTSVAKGESQAQGAGVGGPVVNR